MARTSVDERSTSQSKKDIFQGGSPDQCALKRQTRCPDLLQCLLAVSCIELDTIRQHFNAFRQAIELAVYAHARLLRKPQLQHFWRRKLFDEAARRSLHDDLGFV